MQAWIVSLAVQFALRQLSKYGASLDWGKVKADAIARIKPLIWGPVEPTVDELVTSALDACKAALEHAGAAEALLEKLAGHDVAGAAKELGGLLQQVEHAGAEAAAEGAWTLHEVAA